MKKNFILIGAIFALLAVILGAFGAHALKSQLSEMRLESFETGVRYQFYHAFALLFLGLLYEKWPGRLLNAAGWLMTVGTLFFSGSIYLLAMRDIIGISSWKWLGPITPLGGTLFIISWVLVIIAVLKKP